MKKIFVLILVFIVSGALLYRCEEIETGFDKLSSPADPAATDYYVQFINSNKTYETGLNTDGSLIQVVKPITVTLLGMPQDAPITVTITRDPSSTMATNMYTLSANSVTIPAGKTSASVTFTSVAANMVDGATTKLVLVLNVDGHNSPNTNGVKFSINVKRFKFCPLAPAGFVGSWDGTDGFNSGTHLQASAVSISNPVGSTVKIAGLNANWIATKWGETITDGGVANMTINGDGSAVIPSQYLFTTDYDGSPYEYWIAGTGKWDNCGADPTFVIKYVLTNKTDGYDLPSEYYAFAEFTATISLPGTKGASVAAQKMIMSVSEIAELKALKGK